MPHALGWVPVAPEVHVFQAEIGGDQQFVPARRTQHGAVIANAADQHTRGRVCHTRVGANPLDQLSFG
jgi:hypothetical protein